MRNFVIAISLSLLTGTATADDWPQWRGEKRDGVWRESGIVKKFPKAGLPVKWRVPIHGGYSGPAVVGDKVYVTDYVRRSGDPTNGPSRRAELQGDERVLCLNAETGKLVWKHEYDRPYRISYPSGPRATPTVNDGKVYALGTEGNLICLNTENGKVIWSKQLKKEYKTESPIWGFCGHPLVHGDTLFCLVGGKGSVVVAFDKNNGQELWKSLSASNQGYCPPALIKAGGTDQLLIWHADGLNSLNPKSGDVYWSIPLKPSYEMSIVAPQQHGDFLFASGIGNVGAMMRLDRNKPAAEVVWRGSSQKAIYFANSTPIIDDGIMYGVDCRGGQMRGVEFETGERLWESFQPTTGNRRAGHATAFLVKHQNGYFIFSETGDLILANMSRKGYDEISRFHVLEPTGECFGRSVVWSHPAFAKQCVFARNDKEIVCVSLAAK